jgi:large subunit ribosomal protein L20
MVLEVDYLELPSNQILNLFRALWIARINAGTREHGVTYSIFMNSLDNKKIVLNRKILSDIAISDNATFEEIVKTAIS